MKMIIKSEKCFTNESDEKNNRKSAYDMMI